MCCSDVMQNQHDHFSEWTNFLNSFCTGNNCYGNDYIKRSADEFTTQIFKNMAQMNKTDISGGALRDLYFNNMHNIYSMSSGIWNGLIERLGAHLDPHAAKNLKFISKLMTDAFAPNNFPCLNPVVSREFIESNGASVVRGIKHFVEDFGKGHISTVDTDSFKVGETIATTPGVVVFKNHMFELIHYKPMTEKVFSVPMLVIPPWINKFYILDLSERNSFVRWMLNNGIDVYMISWVNPDSDARHINFEDYLRDGSLKAMEYISSRHKKLQIIGYCLGGTLLAIMLAYLTSIGKANTVAAATFFVSLIDFRDVGDFGVLISKEQIESFKQRIRAKGYVSGWELYAMFSMMRANDMIWKPAVDRYMLGRDAPSIDILAWNADPVNLPAEMSIFYLQKLYLENRLAKPNSIVMCNVPIDVTKIRVPSFFMAAQQDHIVPWRSAYKGALMWPNSTFILSSSGHVAGVINPPSSNKHEFWTNNSLPSDPDAWFSNAHNESGSWWNQWWSWCKPRMGKRTKFKPDEKELGPSPGRYVLKKSSW